MKASNGKKLVIQGWVVIWCSSFAVWTKGQGKLVSGQNDCAVGEHRWLSTKTKLKERLLWKIRSTQYKKYLTLGVWLSSSVWWVLFLHLSHKTLERTSSSSSIKFAKERQTLLFLFLQNNRVCLGEYVSRPISAALKYTDSFQWLDWGAMRM